MPKTTKKAAKRATRTRRTKTEVTSGNMVKLLWETMQGLRDNEVEPEVANSIAAQSREICNVAKVNLFYAKMTGRKPTNLIG